MKIAQNGQEMSNLLMVVPVFLFQSCDLAKVAIIKKKV
jgi:hypothetical protein